MDNIPRWFVLLAGGLGLLLWLVSFIVGLLRKDYKPDPVIGYIAAVIVSACFTRGAVEMFLKRLGKKREEAAEEAEDEPPVPQPHDTLSHHTGRKRPKYPPR